MFQNVNSPGVRMFYFILLWVVTTSHAANTKSCGCLGLTIYKNGGEGECRTPSPKGKPFCFVKDGCYPDETPSKHTTAGYLDKKAGSKNTKTSIILQSEMACKGKRSECPLKEPDYSKKPCTPGPNIFTHHKALFLP